MHNKDKERTGDTAGVRPAQNEKRPYARPSLEEIPIERTPRLSQVPTTIEC